jgi:hypothetical protein
VNERASSWQLRGNSSGFEKRIMGIWVVCGVGLGHRFAAALVRVRAAFGDWVVVLSARRARRVVRGLGRAFLHLSIYVSSEER